MLLIAQLAINEKVLKITRRTLFLANYRKELEIFLKLREGLNAEKALILANDIKNLYKQITAIINYSNTIITI